MGERTVRLDDRHVMPLDSQVEEREGGRADDTQQVRFAGFDLDGGQRLFGSLWRALELRQRWRIGYGTAVVSLAIM